MLPTVDRFKKCFPENPTPAEWTGALCSILPQYDITTPLRIAQFLAQCGHESLGFTRLTENLNYSATALMATWPRRFPPEVANDYARQPERIANRAYADRLGNGPEESGDGWKFRGHGVLQITGRANITAFGKSVGRDPEETLEYLKTKQGAIEAACWFWKCSGLNTLADLEKTESVTRVINGGLHGLEDRKARYALCRRAFA